MSDFDFPKLAGCGSSEFLMQPAFKTLGMNSALRFEPRFQFSIGTREQSHVRKQSWNAPCGSAQLSRIRFVSMFTSRTRDTNRQETNCRSCRQKFYLTL